MAAVFWIGLLLVLGYELYAVHQHQGKTISEVYWRLVAAHPIVAFALGYLAGHLTWQSASVYLGACR